MRTMLTTDDVPGAERLALFREVLSQDSAPSTPYVDDDQSSLHGTMDAGALGPVGLLRLTSRSAARRGMHRTPELIRRSDPEDYRLTFAVHGNIMMTHNGRQVRLGPGDMVMLDSSRPYDAWHPVGSAGFLLLALPKSRLPLPRRYADAYVGACLSGRSGIGALLRTVAGQTVRDLDTYTPDEAARLSAVLLDLVAGMLAHELGVTGVLPCESQQQVMLRRVQGFVQQRLCDPGLTPAMIAKAHHISVRTLHRLFEPGGCTIGEWIRVQRLDRSRRDLADLLLADQPVHAIATRWGFSSHAHFTRTFSAAYGMSPLEYRNRRPSA